ncbi:tol-pal system-associated acyl-CoA thioesterase [Oxalobacteraceae bacterium CAVE-383]|nr:tol-pal system-associated acyl-CoA thioesterase [Oxalobacteraceae bacterium CAVE-383]
MKTDFSWTIRVYYEDTDAGGVVFYANYLKFFERARTEWLRAMGVGQHALAADERVIFIVKSTSVDYLAPAQLDDTLRITVSVAKLGRASVSFTQEAWRMDGSGADRKMLARGDIEVVCVKGQARAPSGPADFRPTAIPASILNSIRNTIAQPAARSLQS